MNEPPVENTDPNMPQNTSKIDAPETGTPDSVLAQDISPASPSPTGETSDAPCPWTLGDFFLFLALVFGAFLFVLIVFIVVISVYVAVVEGAPDAKELFLNPFVNLLVSVLLQGAVFGLLYLLTVVRHRSPFWPAVKLQNTPSHFLQAAALGGILLAVAVQFTPPLFEGQDPFPLKEFFSSPAAAYALSFFAVTAAPFMEELVFRGFMFRIFESRFGITGAVVSTAILFWAIHVPQYWNSWNHLLLISFVALALSGLRAWTGSLLPCIVMHTVYNFMVVLFFYEATDRFKNLPAFIGN